MRVADKRPAVASRESPPPPTKVIEHPRVHEMRARSGETTVPRKPLVELKLDALKIGAMLLLKLCGVMQFQAL